MDNEPDKENGGRRNSNTEYVPTKCRITKPPPPKPATNPLQFIRVAPCPLFQKAQEQIKKVEEIKKERKEIREEAEDWQANLDNWKSSRRKRQEHIIERVVEVKKLAAEEENERVRRRSKTFSEMMEDRSKGRHKFNIPIYDDDSNDLSDYGIRGSHSKASSLKDADTDDSGSILDEKEHSLEFSHNEVNFDAIRLENRTQDLSKSCGSEEILHLPIQVEDTSNSVERNLEKLGRTEDTESFSNKQEQESNISTNSYLSSSTRDTTAAANSKTTIVCEENTNSYLIKKEKPEPPAKPTLMCRLKTDLSDVSKKAETMKKLNSNEHYTYEGAIQDYRSRIRSKINIDESFLNRTQNLPRNKDFTDTQVVPKGEIFKRKEVFEADKPVEIKKSHESNISRRLSEDFVNTQSIKQRLKNLEKCTDQSSKETTKNDIRAVSVKERLETFNKQNDNIINNNINVNSQPHKISNYLIKKSHSSSSFPTKNSNSRSNWQREEIPDRSSSPETEMYMNKLNIFNRDLDNLMIYGKTSVSTSLSLDNRNDNFFLDSNYAPSTSSTEFLGLSSDREDSGIHTADVSCSVSQADESADITELTAKNTMSDTESFSDKKCYLENTEMLSETRSEDFSEESVDCEFVPKSSTFSEKNVPRKEQDSPFVVGYLTKNDIIKETQELLSSLQRDASENVYMPKCIPLREPSDNSRTVEEISRVKQIAHAEEKPDVNCNELKNKTFDEQFTKTESVIYENVELKPLIITDQLINDSSFPLALPKLEPPKVKPPPPPPADDEQNPTQRMKTEMNVKRSSFLGLYGSSEDQTESKIPTEKPPDINYFLQRESKLEKSLYKKLQEENQMGILNKVASQDSGLDVDRGRLSSDTWCSSTGDSTTPSHDRQDSDHTHSITSEEDEISKKEREIIEMVEKEEKCRDAELTSYKFKADGISNGCKSYQKHNKFGDPFYTPPTTNYIDDQDSEVLKVEQELRQLEKEELERQKENMLFRESRAKAHFHNRHSLENICDEIFTPYGGSNDKTEYGAVNELSSVPQEYRKSMPDVLNTYKMVPETELYYRKSLPEIQQTYRNNLEYGRSTVESPVKIPVDHSRSLPELQHDAYCSAFKSPISRPPALHSNSNSRSVLTSRNENDKYTSANGKPSKLENHSSILGKPKQLTRHSLHTLSAVPRPKHTDSWVRPEPKHYNQHWVYQEAELRRLSNQHKSISDQNQLQPQKKHIPDSIIQTLTRRVQNRANEWNPVKRTINNLNKEYIHHQYLYHSNNMGRALPLQYNNNNTVPVIDTQERMLSVSGKKKCSYCGNELGRGAAMIIESLHLFYHMECFKCCVCHVQLGDGLMGTDVRVRNQKLHCHNCYSSDDGVKFSCV